MSEEIWKDIRDYKELYQISNLGRVKSLSKEVFSNRWNPSIRVTNERILSPKKDGGNYLYVSLRKNKVAKNFKIHRLVALHFINNPGNKGQVNHKDFNKENNNVSNLEWTTPKENTHHAILNNRVKRYTLNIEGIKLVKEFLHNNVSTTEIHKKFGLSYRQIRKIINNQNWNFINGK